MAERQVPGAAGNAAGLAIDDRFRVLTGMQLADLGGHACFEAQDRRGIAGEVVALRMDPGAPARARLAAFGQLRHEALLSPLAHGAAGGAYWIATNRPPGPSLASLATPWSGNGLLTHVLRPAAVALDQLQIAGLTHRSIRPDNVFLSPGGKTVVLGPCWGAPPAHHQPAVFEAPYSAICPPAARGDGSIADDVYALGVLLLALWTGKLPLAGLEPRAIIQLKLEYGSHSALTNGLRLQRGFDDILRAMLSDDPLARPTPATLANLDAIHARRGGQRVAVRAARPVAIGEKLAWNRRMLAFLSAEAPGEAMALLRQGVIEQWLRRTAEDGAIGSGIEELRRDQLLLDARGASRGAGVAAAAVDHVCLMRLIALLDPLAPLFWRGLWLWPDGLGPLLANALTTASALDPRQASALLDDLHRGGGMLARWWQMRPNRPQQDGPDLAQQLLRRSERDGEQGILLRAAYALNPFLPCASQSLGEGPVTTPVAIVEAVERSAGSGPGKPLLDAHILAFLDARLEDASADAAEAAGDPLPAMRELRLLARCRALAGCGPTLRIAGSLLPQLEPLLQDWPGVSRKARRLDRLRTLAAVGDLASMLELMTDAESRTEDDAAREAATAKAAEIATALAGLTEALPWNLLASRNAARDTAAASGILCIMAALLYELLG